MKTLSRIAAAAAMALCLTGLGAAPAHAGTTSGTGAGDGPSAQVVGGGDVPDGAHPFAAAILQEGVPGDDRDKQFCSGALIDPGWVLTAAHCVDEHAPTHLAVTVGRTVLSSEQGERFGVAEVVEHPDWDRERASYDVALLRLSGTSSAPPIRLVAPHERGYDAPGSILTVAGWGMTDPRSYDAPDRLQSAELEVLDDARCAGAGRDGAMWVCAAGAPGVSACSGDSGGPFFATDPQGSPVLVGSSSWGTWPCGAPGGFDAFVELAHPRIRSFIDQTVRTPLDPCYDANPAHRWFGTSGDAQRVGDELRWVRRFDGKVCPTARTDRFSTTLESSQERGLHQRLGATLRFDPALGAADLRLSTCDETGSCTPLTATATGGGHGSRTVEWQNTSGRSEQVLIDVELHGGGRAPLDYELEAFVTDTCVEWSWDSLRSPGAKHVRDTACPGLDPGRLVFTTLPHGSQLRADLAAYGGGTGALRLVSCGGGSCVEHGFVAAGGDGTAEVAWVNCSGAARSSYVEVVHTAGAAFHFDLDVVSSEGASCP